MRTAKRLRSISSPGAIFQWSRTSTVVTFVTLTFKIRKVSVARFLLFLQKKKKRKKRALSFFSVNLGHLESQHRDMTFKCLLRGCAQPRFTQANKVIDHVRCNHHQDYRRTRNDDDLFRMKMVSMPKSLASYGCRECNVVFHGDIKIAIVHLVSNLYFNFVAKNWGFSGKCATLV